MWKHGNHSTVIFIYLTNNRLVRRGCVIAYFSPITIIISAIYSRHQRGDVCNISNFPKAFSYIMVHSNNLFNCSRSTYVYTSVIIAFLFTWFGIWINFHIVILYVSDASLRSKWKAPGEGCEPLSSLRPMPGIFCRGHLHCRMFTFL